MKKNQKGITIVGLLITVIVIITIAGVCIYTGKDILEEAKLEQLKTNMLLIQAKCQSVGERVTAKELEIKDYIGTSVAEIDGIDFAEDDIWYGLTEKDVEEKEYNIVDNNGVEVTKKGVGLGDVIKQDEDKILYYFNYKNNEVVYAKGYNGKYTLTQILETDAE